MNNERQCKAKRGREAGARERRDENNKIKKAKPCTKVHEKQWVRREQRGGGMARKTQLFFPAGSQKQTRMVRGRERGEAPRLESRRKAEKTDWSRRCTHIQLF